MIEFGIIFLIIVVMLGAGFSLLHLSNNQPSSEPAVPSSTFAETQFTPTQMYLDHAGQHGIALNESTRTICVIHSSTRPPQLLQFTELAGSFILKNGTVIHSTLRTQPQEYAMLANTLQEQIGAVNAAEPPNARDNTNNQKVELCLVTLDQEHSIHRITFLDMETKEEGILFNKAMASTKHWHHLLSDLIQQANAVETQAEFSPSSQNQSQDSTMLVAR
ncbi:MAG: hypothetical protein NPIRA02_29050 [Nitrospirales bacterium]|nr:MAG: hypothetical protein NPIRA02_29050 [Nitrospirales bacterium]